MLFGLAMILVGQKILKDFMAKNADSREAFKAWRTELKVARWKSPLDVKQRYSTVSIISATRFVFNIRGNHYRIDATIQFKPGVAIINRIGKHSDYDGWKF